jgi:hypothetical protein
MHEPFRASKKIPARSDRYTISLDLRETPEWSLLCTTARDIGIRFGLGSKVVGRPHITLYGPFTLKAGVTLEQVRAAITALARDHKSLEFTLSGWMRLKSRGLSEVIGHKVIASPEFADFYCAIPSRLQGLAVSHKWQDHHPDPSYLHISVILGLYYHEMVEDIWQSLVDEEAVAPLILTANASRVTLKGTFRTMVFDLSRQKWLPRDAYPGSRKNQDCGDGNKMSDNHRTTEAGQ